MSSKIIEYKGYKIECHTDRLYKTKYKKEYILPLCFYSSISEIKDIIDEWKLEEESLEYRD